jgi:outer membrane lipoprotein-sorting protein
MKKINRISATAILFLLTIPLQAQTGREIMQQAADKDMGDTTHTLVQMDLIDKNGTVSNRVVEMFGKENSEGSAMIMVIFHRPATVKGTRFLSITNEGRADDMWIYLPSLKRVRRIAASEGGESFMGTDLTYDDMGSKDVDNDDHTLVGEEDVDGYPCYVVESVPRDPSESEYSRRKTWVSREMLIPIRMELFDKEGALLKVLTVSEIENIQGFWTPKITRMTNVQENHSTVLTMERVIYNENLPDGIFTTRFLQTGRL